MNDAYFESMKEKILGEVEERYRRELDGLCNTIDDLKVKGKNAIVSTGLVASLVGGCVGFVIPRIYGGNDISKLEKRISNIENEINQGTAYNNVMSGFNMLPEEERNKILGKSD